MGSTRPLFVQGVRGKHPDQQVEVWFEDEARFGQKGSLTTIWADRGSRPTRIKQSQYKSVYAWASVNPLTGESVSIVSEEVNTKTMNGYLEMMSGQIGPKRHAVLVLDQAGWHRSKTLKVPDNVTLLHLPPYSPELNPIERVWLYERQHYLCNRAFKDLDELWEAVSHADRSLTPDNLKSICRTAWIERTN